MAGKVSRAEIAEKLGVSLANLKRSCPGVSFATTWVNKMNPERTREVILYYFKHGKIATEKKYPHLNIKGIVDRPEYYGVQREYRQRRWTDSEMIEAVKMSGLISLPAQALYFNRPGANSGSIKSLWVKRYGLAWASINGMARNKARRLVQWNKAKYIKVYGTSRDGKPIQFRKVMLWVEMEKCVRDEMPDFIKDGIKAMADFQRWIWKSENPKPLILKMIKEREMEYSE